MTYSLVETESALEILRADGSWVFTLRPNDLTFVQQILERLNRYDDSKETS